MTNPKPPCSIDGCERPAKAHGWCVAHYARNRRYGSPTDSAPRMTEIERFESKVRRQFGGCWEWVGGKDPDGYAVFFRKEGSKRAQRFAYEHWRGPIPAGLVTDHLCENKGCVNPYHLEAVTDAVNIKRGELADTNRRRRRA